MIKTVYGLTGIQASGGSNGPYTIGAVRWNGTKQSMEVMDSNGSFVELNGTASVGLDSPTQEVIQWARNTMERERKIAELAKMHPTLKAALEQAIKANEAVDIITKLVETHQNETK